MRDTFDIPIIGIEPAIKPAAAATKTGVVGVIATTRTITSERYLRLVREFAGTKVKVVSVPCPGSWNASKAVTGTPSRPKS